MSVAQIIKTDDELRLAFGWANVSVYDGEEVVDTQDDITDTTDLVKAFMSFMSDVRKGGIMHARGADDEPVVIGEVVFAFPFTADLKKAMGIEIPQEGVVIGLRVDDDATWAAVKDGRLAAFSIAGKAQRIPVEAD